MVYDAIIIGAGPAGGMAARKLTAKSFSVLIIDKKREVGVPVQCGEAITHFGLKENGISPQKDWIKQEVRGAKPIMPDGSYFYAGQKGYSIMRDKFDQWIVNGAFANGAELMLRTRATSVKRKENIWRVFTKKGEFDGRLLIGADGPSSNVASWLGLLKSRVYFRAMEYKFPAKDFDFQEKEWLSFFMGAGWNKGYAWVFPRDDEWNIGVTGFGKTPESMKKFVKMLKLDKNSRTQETAGLVPRRYNLSSITKEGVMIVGDAAGTTNPVFGGGIHAALSSGRIAGETGVKVLENENPSLTMEYVMRMGREPYMRQLLHKCADHLQNWTDEDWNFLGWMMEGKDWSEVSLSKSMLRILRKPKYLIRGREFLLIRKAMHINLKYGW